VDTFSQSERAGIMRRVPARNSRPEIALRRLLHSLGYRFRLHRQDLPGSPDIVLPKHGLCIFVHGCFWHRHKNCRRASIPSTNVEYWEKKFAGNVERDKRNLRLLRARGWRTMVVWECELTDQRKLQRRIDRRLR